MSRARQPRASQRWPDLMIGAVTLALLGGFGTLLLGERKPAVAAQTSPNASATPAIPASPGTVPEPQAVTPTPAAPATSTPAQTAQTQTPTTPAQTPANPAQTTEIPPAPATPPVEAIKPPVVPANQAPQASAQAPQTATASDLTQAATSPTTPVITPRPGGAVATSENRVPLRSDYRISLGSFGSRKTAETQTAGVRGLGYTVHAIDLGDQYVAQIGPFADEASARQALADIQRSYPGALLYRPRNKPADTTSDTSSTTATPSNTAQPTSSTTPQAAAPRTPAAAPSGPTYLQVGAFDRVESAQNLVGILKDNGFAPTVNNPPDQKTTVMVGPYSGDALLRAEARLDNAGLDHFRVR